jgi:hypothetical protein
MLELLPFFGFIILGCATFYVCCKKIKNLQNEINRENIQLELEIEEIIVEENSENENLSLPPPYKLRDDPPSYTIT